MSTARTSETFSAHDGPMAERWDHVHILESRASQDGSWMVRSRVMKMREIWGKSESHKRNEDLESLDS